MTRKLYRNLKLMGQYGPVWARLGATTRRRRAAAELARRRGWRGVAQ